MKKIKEFDYRGERHRWIITDCQLRVMIRGGTEFHPPKYDYPEGFRFKLQVERKFFGKTIWKTLTFFTDYKYNIRTDDDLIRVTNRVIRNYYGEIDVKAAIARKLDETKKSMEKW